MEHTTKLTSQSVVKTFFQYFIPTVLGMMLMTVNIVVDGMFVGHAIGEQGIAAINIVSPVFSFFISLALLFGIGGGTLFSMALGRGDKEGAQRAFSTSFTVGTLLMVGLTVIALFNMELIVKVFGATPQTSELALDYLAIILSGGIVFFLSNVIGTFVRNDGNPNLALIGMTTSAIVNIILNYVFLFVLDYGIQGAAAATLIGATCSLAIVSTHFLRKERAMKFVKPSLKWGFIASLIAIGLPSFVAESAIAINTFGYNFQLIRYDGDLGATAFGVINYSHTIVLLLFIGIDATMQPLISFYHGAKLKERITETVRVGWMMSLAIALLFVGTIYFTSEPLIQAFGVTNETTLAYTKTGMVLFFISYLWMGINMVNATVWQCTNRERLSLVFTVLRGIVLLGLFLAILPPLFGTNGIWLAIAAAECSAFFVSLWLGRSY